MARLGIVEMDESEDVEMDDVVVVVAASIEIASDSFVLVSSFPMSLVHSSYFVRIASVGEVINSDYIDSSRHSMNVGLVEMEAAVAGIDTNPMKSMDSYCSVRVIVPCPYSYSDQSCWMASSPKNFSPANSLDHYRQHVAAACMD